MESSLRWAPLSRFLIIPSRRKQSCFWVITRSGCEEIAVEKNEKLQALYQLILKLETEEECEALFGDLCTRKELINMAERLRAAKLLMEGKTYNQVIAETNISSATLSRVSQCVQYGKGYSQFVKK